MILFPDFLLQVMIFRLITRDTIEERMMQLTKKKMILEHLVVGRLKAQTVNQVLLYYTFNKRIYLSFISAIHAILFK